MTFEFKVGQQFEVLDEGDLRDRGTDLSRWDGGHLLIKSVDHGDGYFFDTGRECFLDYEDIARGNVRLITEEEASKATPAPPIYIEHGDYKGPTPHRVMYEALTEEEYKQFCRNIPAYGDNSLSDALKWANLESASSILLWAFYWEESPEGLDYWDKINNRLQGEGE